LTLIAGGSEKKQQVATDHRDQVEWAERQFQAVEPANRLMARTLKKRWEAALGEARNLEEEYAHFCQQQPATLGEQEVAQVRALAEDLPALWWPRSTTPADGQQFIRFLVERVMVAMQGNSNRVQPTVECRPRLRVDCRTRVGGEIVDKRSDTRIC